MVSYSSLLALQPCVGLSLLHAFVTVNSSEVVSLAPTPKLEDQGLYFDWPLPFELSDMDGLTRSLHSRQHSSPGLWARQISPPQGGSARGGPWLVTDVNFVLELLHRVSVDFNADVSEIHRGSVYV
jgi:hypothetical protein